MTMKKMNLPIRDLKESSVRWRFRKPLTTVATLIDQRQQLLESSWLRMGPAGWGELVVVQSPEGFALVDGYRRLAFAQRHGITDLGVVVLSEDEGVAITEQVLLNEFDAIIASAARKAAFVVMMNEVGIDDATIIKVYLPLIGIEAHNSQLARCRKIGGLGRDILEFCHEKGFAMSQCFHLTRHSRELLELVFGWRDRLSLSANQFEQALDLLRDVMVARELSCEQLMNELGLGEILAVQAFTPQQRAKAFFEKLRALRQPLLTQINARLDELRRAMELPREVSVGWDATLEREQLSVTIAVGKETSWEGICRKLASNEVETFLGKMLKEL